LWTSKPGSCASGYFAHAGFRASRRQLQAHPQHSGAGGLYGRRGHRPEPAGAGPELELYEEFTRIAGQPIENAISKLRPKVDLFFDKVLVNAPDATVRQNRLTLLHTLLAEFSTMADFSEIVTNS